MEGSAGYSLPPINIPAALLCFLGTITFLEGGVMLMGVLDGPGERRHIRALTGSEFMCDGNHHTNPRIKEDLPQQKEPAK